MSIRFRKRINLGGFRINISKSGIGYSYGVKGFRITKKAKGGTRRTASIPGTGISYVSDSKKIKKNKHSQTKNNNQVFAQNQVKIIDNPINEVQTQLTKRMRLSFFCNKLLWFIVAAIPISFILGVSTFSEENYIWIPFWVVFFISPIILIFVLKLRKTKLFYEQIHSGENIILEKYDEKIVKYVNELNKCALKFKLVGTINNVGQAGVIKESLKINQPKTIKSNIDLCQMETKNSNLIFLPDLVLFFKNNKYYSIKYTQLNVDYVDVPMPMHVAPSDSVVIRQRYVHETKNQQPDARYKNNPLLYECSFGGIEIKSDSGLVIDYLFSNAEKAKLFSESLNQYIELCAEDN